MEPIIETSVLERRAEDDNGQRQAYIIAIHDWCWGGDGQWLVAVSEENAYYSHDHGWYLPPEGPTWDIASLVAAVDQPHELPGVTDGITPDHARQVGAALQRVTRDSILGALAAIPAAWPVSDGELECVGFFFERRAPAAADRLLKRIGGVR
jgi:hypothetical protein